MDTFLPIITQLEDKKLADTLVEVAKDKDRLDVVFLGFNAEQVFDILGYNVHPWCCALVLAVAGKDLVHDSNRTKMKTQEGAGDALSLNQPTPPPPQEPSGKLSAAEFFKYACAFLESTDLNLLGPVHTFVGVIARALGDAAIQSNQAPPAIEPLLNIINSATDTYPGCVLPAHTALLKVCLFLGGSSNLNICVPMLDKYVYDIEPLKTGLTTEDLMLYFYYGGIVFGGLKRYGKAAEFFLLATTMPAAELSAIAVEAYKKYFLTAAIAHGEAAGLPKVAPVVVKRHIHTLVLPYSKFAAAFKDGDFKLMEQVGNMHSAVFLADGNFSLIKKAFEAFKRRKLSNLTKTYVTLSLTDIAKTVELEDVAMAETILRDMISKQEIFASIDATSGMVSFLEEENLSEVEERRLSDMIQETGKLAASIEKLSRDVSLSNQYLSKLPKLKTQDGESDTPSAGGAQGGGSDEAKA